ncbi:MAG: NAD(P)H-hydrate epimerase [Eggerthellaceae bacterium]
MRLSSPATAQSPTLDVAKVIELEKNIEAAGTPLSKLMDQAGAALAELIADRCEPESRILVVCGSGNNGGDGWVAARLLEEQGFRVAIATPKPAEEIAAQPARDAALRTAGGFRGKIVVAQESIPENALEGNAAVVDCILGTGFDHDRVKEPFATWIAQMNAASGAKIACDTPSGLSAQTGKAASVCFKADTTITMLAVKTGLATPDAAPFTGELFLAPLEGR